MPVHAQVWTLISPSFQGSVGAKLIKKTTYHLPLGTPNLKAIGSTWRTLWYV
ncbi:hypothetical protein MXB_2426 [Myxobolus squamalis]|nr:hypothetical protein MXB_2426 [Myxobolus squamalis]